MKILETIRVFTLRNIVLRGHEEHGLKDSMYEILKLRGSEDSELMQFIGKDRGTYLHHDCQNEILDLMASRLLHDHIIKPIQKAQFFTIMCDESTDISNKEQAAVCIRWVSENFEIREDFIGLFELHSITSDAIFNMLKDVLLRFNLPMSKIKGLREWPDKECDPSPGNWEGTFSV